MKIITLFIFILFCASTGHSQNVPTTIPVFMAGNFMDDYGISYKINDTLWIQLPGTKYHIIKWNVNEQFILAKNDAANETGKDLYTRIDYMVFENMAPYTWGFCLTAYEAANEQDAENAVPADRKNPIKGCNGFPFSRMKIGRE